MKSALAGFVCRHDPDMRLLNVWIDTRECNNVFKKLAPKLFKRPRIAGRKTPSMSSVRPFVSPQKLSLPSHIKQRFLQNEDAWIFVFRYFYQYLPVLRQSIQKPCVIFDIDHTVLQYRSPLGRVFAGGTIHHGLELRPTSKYMVGLFQMFRAQKVPIYFVTGRPMSKVTKAGTERELETLGLTGYETIHFMPSVLFDVGTFKESVRAQLRERHHVLFNVGDQWTDIANVRMDDSYDNVACLLYGVESNCDWALKLIPIKDTHPFMAATDNGAKKVSSSPSIYDSVFETFAPIPSPDVCQTCGHLRIYH